MRRRSHWILFAFAFCSGLLMAQSGDQAVGFVVSATDVLLTTAGAQTSMKAQAGDILFPGDTLNAAAGTVTFFYCPQSPGASAFSYTVSSKLVIGNQPGGMAGLNGSPAGICIIPSFERNPDVATVRSPREILPNPPTLAAVRQQIQTLEPAARASLESLSQQDLRDPRLRLAFAVLLENAGFMNEALAQYLELAAQWPRQPRILKYAEKLWASPGTARAIIQPPATPAPPAKQGKTFALVIGISKYEQREKFPDLPFAGRDAAAFATYLKTERGGVPAPMLLKDQDATSGAIRNYFNSLKTKAGKDDSVIVFVAAHGDMLDNIPSLITRRADPQDPSINSLPLAELQNLVLGRSDPFRRAMMFVDLCHSGHAARFERPADKVTTPYFLMTATNESKNALAYEDEIFDRGHGVFTYFLLRGLNTGEAPQMLGLVSQSVTAAALKTYVEARVAYATSGRQSPTSALGVDPTEEIANLSKKGMPFDTTDIALLRMSFGLRASRSRALPADQPSPAAAALPPTDSPDLERRIDLENQGEAILLRYLKGDETPQTQSDFARGARIFQDALSLQPGAPYLMARASFCEGRSLIFKKEYAGAIDLLEDSIRLDPSAAYGYNALGIAYLERANYSLAIAAFQDAIQRAPNWAYPRHNLALTYTQTGNYAVAIAQYRKAMELAPQYSYLHYNLGLVFQKINRTRDAEREYLGAWSLAPDNASSLIALGVLKAGEGNRRRAERYYRQAFAVLDQHPDAANVLTARHNLAGLLGRKRKSFSEAEQLWRQNIKAENYMPSRISYAAALLTPAAKDRPGRIDEAIAQYRAILLGDPDQVGIRLRLADLLEANGQLEDALLELVTLQRRHEEDCVVYERLGALQQKMGKLDEARSSFQKALQYCSDASERKRIRRRLND